FASRCLPHPRPTLFPYTTLFRSPYPIESVLLPKALRVSTISIGMTLIDDPARRGRTMRDVPEESLMLTGDENIVDVDFTVLWRIDRKSTRLNSSHGSISYAVFCL